MRPREKVTEFIVLVVREFAKEKNMFAPEAYNYLSKYKGIEYLEKHYEYEHTLAFPEIIDNLSEVCTGNGGDI